MAGAGDAIRNAIPTPPIDQTAVLFGALAFAFLIYITVTPASDGKSHLSHWLAIFGL